MQDNKLQVFVLLAILLALGGVSQSIWWLGPSLMVEQGVAWTIFSVALAVLLVAGLLFQAERLLIFFYNPAGMYEEVHAFPPQRSFWLYLFMVSALLGGLLLTSHHMLVSSWQSNVHFSIYTEHGLLPSFPLLLASQQELLGGFGKQFMWLLYVLIGSVLVVWLLATRLLVWLLVLVVLIFLLGFGMFFVVELPLPPLQDDNLPLAKHRFYDSFVLVLETSLAGFGVVMGLARWRGVSAYKGWLLGMLVLLVTVYLLHLLGAWQFARFTWIGKNPESDRLLLHLPYVLYQVGSDWLYWFWGLLALFLSLLKIGLILSFGALIIAHLTRMSFLHIHMLLVVLAGFLAFCWLVIGYFGRGEENDSMGLLFKILFEGLLFWWYPLHLLLLAMLAFAVPTEDHTAYVWRGYSLFAYLLRLSYVPLMGFLLWYLFNALDIQLLQPGSGG